jgi:hypothetical protein
MKRTIFIMCVLVTIAFVGPMLIKKPDGTPFIKSPLDWFSTSLAGLHNNESSSSNSQSFYKWQDDDGTWHYSDKSPAKKNIETVTVNINTNLIQGLRVVKKNEQPIIEKNLQPKVENSPIALSISAPIEKISKILEDANNIQQLMDNRNKQIEQATLNR